MASRMDTRIGLPWGAAFAAAFVACGGGEPESGAPREPAAARGPARLEVGLHPPPLVRALRLAEVPPQAATGARTLGLVLDGFHVSKAEAGRPAEQQHQARALHDCAQMNADFVQCAVFDGDGEDAHLVGVEYVISGRLHEGLSRDERLLWHAHAGEVDAGLLVAPGVPEPTQGALRGLLRPTYGKAWRLWDSVRDGLPFGEPVLMWPIAPQRINAGTRAVMEARAGGE